MEIDFVADTDTHWLIYCDDGVVYPQRKYVLQAIDPRMDRGEEIICALCIYYPDHINSPKKRGLK